MNLMLECFNVLYGTCLFLLIPFTNFPFCFVSVMNMHETREKAVTPPTSATSQQTTKHEYLQSTLIQWHSLLIKAEQWHFENKHKRLQRDKIIKREGQRQRERERAGERQTKKERERERERERENNSDINCAVSDTLYLSANYRSI